MRRSVKSCPVLPVAKVVVNNASFPCTCGCSQSIVSVELASGKGHRGVVAGDGRKMCGVGEADVELGGWEAAAINQMFGNATSGRRLQGHHWNGYSSASWWSACGQWW